MKSTLKNMILMLFVIALVSAAAVAVVYDMTKEPIRQAQEQKVVDALRKVLPAFESVSERVERDGCGVYEAMDAEGAVVGYALESTSPNGFSGNVKLMIGIETDGTIYNIEVLEQAETPGLGANMTNEDNALISSFKGRDGAKMTMTVKKDGGDVDALTAATISSRAYSEAVAIAYGVFESIREESAAAAFNPAVVLPENDDVFAAEMEGVTVYTATKEGHAVGYAIEGSSEKGYNGTVKLLVGFEIDGTIHDVMVLEQRETPGLGSKMCDENNALLMSLKGKRASRVRFALRSEGGSVDALSSATISSRAYTEAVAAAYEVFKKINQ